jgi:hypothetical protein
MTAGVERAAARMSAYTAPLPVGTGHIAVAGKEK